ncbi:hypothetical protein AAFC00_003552 [Neodothiora populina]|uniref:Zn(2)-C6 fungal-type domain-containing protein n=1 Tax=Neodothiora populina TaxID=2781224 RepID=A0ABR3PES2_9PEZI
MADVEHAPRSEDFNFRDSDGRRQTSSAVQFTPVNRTSPPLSRVTSFRPEHTELHSSIHQISSNKETTENPSHSRIRPHVAVGEEAPYAREQGAIVTYEREASNQPRYNPGKRKRSPRSSSPSRSPKQRGLQVSPPAEVVEQERPLSTTKGPDHVPTRTGDNAGSATSTSIKTPQWAHGPDQTDDADKLLAENLQHNLRAHEDNYSRDDDDEGSHPEGYEDHRQHSDEDTPRNNPSLDQPGQQRKPVRKRIFSQRTKTGCHTCRRRKKKCDETKPICNNCIRGGFPCDGYGPKALLATRSHKPQRVIASKVASISTFNTLNQYPSTTVMQEPERSSSQQTTLSPMEGSRQLQQEPQLAAPYTPWPKPTEIIHADRDSVPHHAYHAHLASTASAHNPSMTEPPSGVSPRHDSAYASTTASNNGISKFRINAGSYGNERTSEEPRYVGPLVTEKVKMLMGRLYRHYTDEQLLNERNECKLSLERYNKCCLASNGSGPRERLERFLNILQPKWLGPNEPIGSCGSGVIVEAPFSCQYGYNINIGDNVVIGAGCVMLDPCKITIGSRTVIGPNVKFYGMTAPIDPKLRNGSQGLRYGGSITIEEDCWIGGNVTILPFRTIRKGSVIGADTVVTKDVRANTVVAGKPMQVLRGIGQDESDRHKPQIQEENDACLANMLMSTTRVGPAGRMTF